MRNYLCCFFILLTAAAVCHAEDEPFENPLLAQAVQAQQDRDFETAQKLFERYISGLPAKEQALYKDISRVAPAAELKIYTQAPDSEKAAVLNRFWNRVDPSPLTGANERLIEHYRRVAYARTQFGKGRFPWDDRGEVYVRFGAPDHISRSSDMNIEMDRDVQDARQNFVNRKHLALAVTPGQPTFPVPANTHWIYWVYVNLDGGTEFTFISRFRSKTFEFAPVPDGLDVSTTADLMAYQGAVVMKEIASHTPSVYRTDYSTLPIDFYYFPAAFRGADDQTRLEIYYGLPARDMARLPADNKTDRILIDRGVAVFDSVWAEVDRVSDQLTFSMPSDQQILDGAFIPGVLSFNVTPGLHYLAFQMRDVVSGKSQMYQQEIALPDFRDQDHLMMSDIELAFWIGPSEETGPFVKHGLKVIPMASKAFRADQNAFVFFEVYNLKRDAFGQTKYRVEYTFRTREKGVAPVRALRGLGRLLHLTEKAKEIEIAYEQTGATADDMAYVELDLRKVSPGDQLVSVDVTDLLSNQDAHKEIAFDIVP